MRAVDIEWDIDIDEALEKVHSMPVAEQAKTFERIFIASEMGVENVFWDRIALKKSFEKKYTNKFVYAKAQSRGAGAAEEFYFSEAYEVSGFSYEVFVQLLEEGNIYVDLRIGQYPDGRTHDHGTGFRIREIDQPLLFRVNRRIV